MPLNESNLHDYQRIGVDFIVKTEKCALWLDMGLGKTITTATALAKLFDRVEIEKVLIIAPLRVANTVWKKELGDWAHTQHLRVSVCTGTELQRSAALAVESDIYVINCEQVQWIVERYGKKWPFDCLVIDESSKFKSTKSQRFKSLRKVLPKINRLIQLTGTPSPNGLLDVYAQIYLLDRGLRLGRSFTQYKQTFFIPDFMGFKFTPLPNAKSTIESKISDLVLTMKASDYLDLPKRVDLTIRVDLPNRVMVDYMRLERECVLELNAAEIVAMSAATLAGKLLQYANGCVYDADKNIILIHESKINALRAIVDENDNENLLVAYNYQHDLLALQDVFPDAVLLDKDGSQVEAWNSGKIKMLLAHPASAGMGLNLQKGGSVVVWYGLTWNLENYLQFNARLDRQGQTKPVRVIHIVSGGTIDERVMQSLTEKEETQSALMSALKYKYHVKNTVQN